MCQVYVMKQQGMNSVVASHRAASEDKTMSITEAEEVQITDSDTGVQSLYTYSQIQTKLTSHIPY